MAVEAREIEAFLRRTGQPSLADQARGLAEGLEAAGILRIAHKVELPKGIRTETLTTRNMSKVAITAEYRKRGIHVSPYAQDLIDRVALSQAPRGVKLAWLSGRDLGLTANSPYRAFLEAGLKRGFNKCGPEIALYLRLQDTSQPLREWYWMAMEPIADRIGDLHVFALARSEDGLWLDADWTYPANVWSPGGRLVFSLSK